jgi:serine phosphatase RsbU (regulator of sigma subunit)/anti-sigma regulatory factor (Ser/Thr protein kinase)
MATEPQPRVRRQRFRPPAPPLPEGTALPTAPTVPTPTSPDSPPEWLEPAMAANGIGSFDWDIRRNRLEGDLRACTILGLEPERLTEGVQGLLDVVHPEDVPVIRRRVGRAMQEHGQCGAYFRTVFPGGEQRAARFRGRVLAGSDGQPSRMVGFVWDATAELHKRTRDDRLALLREQRTRFVKEAARALSEAGSVRDVARVFVELPFPPMSSAGRRPDGLAMGVVDGGRLQVLNSSGYDDASGYEARLPYRQLPMGADSPCALAVRTRTPVFVSSREEYRERFPEAGHNLDGNPRSSWAFLPLVASGRSIGFCMIAYDSDDEFDAEERAVLSTLGGLVAQSLARARLHDAEHELAAGLQRVLLPRRVPPVTGVTTAVRYLPAASGLQIGGDWYDVVPLPGGHVGLVIGDVQGHDVHAAGVMGQLRIALRAYAAEGHPPAAVMARASRFLADLDTGYFATCTYAEVNVTYGAVYAVRAGHLDPIVRRADGSCAVQPVAGGLPLGIAPEEEYPVTRFTLDPGELLVLCTDGLVESRTMDVDTGMDRLRELLAGSAGQEGPGGLPDLEALADRIEAAADTYERVDDIALLLLRWDGLTGARPSHQIRRRVAQADLARIADVRAELRDAVRRWGVGELADTAELLASELLTNALVHTDRDAMLTARLYDALGGRLRVEVEDESDQWPKRRTPGEQASSGRGLLLVEALADDWGVEPRGSGKRMWFELTAPPEGSDEDGAGEVRGADRAGTPQP